MRRTPTYLALGVAATVLASVGLASAATTSTTSNGLTTIDSCRLIDTRAIGPIGDRGTPLEAGEEITISVIGDTGDCVGISASATAASIQVTAIGATERTFFTLYPADVERPTISQLNPNPNERVTSNSVLVPLTDGGEFTLYNNAGQVDIAIDLLAIYAEIPAIPGPTGPAGPVGPAGPSEPAEYTGPNWGVLPRSIIGPAQAFLRGGPSSANFTELGATPQQPPFGDGSLHLFVPDGSSKIDFGNEVDFADDDLLTLLQAGVGFYFYATGESNGLATVNVPSIKIEIDPNGAGSFAYDAGNPSVGVYSTLVFVPAAEAPDNRWTNYVDATLDAAGSWFLTGNTGPCSPASFCAFSELEALLAAADAPPTIHSVGVGKGRDDGFVGAIDGFRLGALIYDFEPLGVFEAAAT